MVTDLGRQPLDLHVVDVEVVALVLRRVGRDEQARVGDVRATRITGVGAPRPAVRSAGLRRTPQVDMELLRLGGDVLRVFADQLSVDEPTHDRGRPLEAINVVDGQSAIHGKGMWRAGLLLLENVGRDLLHLRSDDLEVDLVMEGEETGDHAALVSVEPELALEGQAASRDIPRLVGDRLRSVIGIGAARRRVERVHLDARHAVLGERQRLPHLGLAQVGRIVVFGPVVVVPVGRVQLTVGIEVVLEKDGPAEW